MRPPDCKRSYPYIHHHNLGDHEWHRRRPVDDWSGEEIESLHHTLLTLDNVHMGLCLEQVGTYLRPYLH